MGPLAQGCNHGEAVEADIVHDTLARSANANQPRNSHLNLHLGDILGNDDPTHHQLVHILRHGVTCQSPSEHFRTKGNHCYVDECIVSARDRKKEIHCPDPQDMCEVPELKAAAPPAYQRLEQLGFTPLFTLHVDRVSVGHGLRRGGRSSAGSGMATGTGTGAEGSAATGSGGCPRSGGRLPTFRD